MKPEEMKPGPLHEKCLGCARANRDKMVCPVYINPARWWDNLGGCPMATHWSAEEKKAATERVRAGQQKQKKKK